jgi:predicted RND superfamily exporter protein
VDTGHALFTSATTTAFPFLALAVSDVRVLAELGLLVGLGVIFSLYATLFFLPPLLLFMEKRFPLKEYRPLPGFSLGAIWDAGRRRWRLNIALALSVVLGLLLSATGISFESELKNLQPRSSEAFLTQEKMERHLSISPKQLIVAVEGRDLNEVLSRGGRVENLARQLRQRGEIVSFSSLGQVINEAGNQRKIIDALKSGIDSSDLGSTLRTSLAQQGFAVEPFRDYLQRLAGLGHSETLPVGEGLAHLTNSPFRGIVERLVIHTPSGYHLLTYLNYNGPEFRQAAFLDALHGVDPLARATSVDLVSRQLTESVRQSFVWALIIGGALVMLLLVSHFNAPAGIFYSLFPLFAGIIAMLGLMALCDMRLNFMNVMVLVTIMGMGSDYGLHVAHRVRNCAEDEFKGRFIQSGRAVLISALTNIVGFGSLAFIDYGALASIGWATIFGVVAITSLTLVTLPAFMRCFGGTGKLFSG